MERNVLEFVDHLHEHFLYPCSINSNGRYNVPTNDHEGYRYVMLLFLLNIVFLTISDFIRGASHAGSIEMHKESIATYEFPNGSYWREAIAAREKAQGL